MLTSFVAPPGQDEPTMCPVCGDNPSDPRRAPFCSRACWDEAHCECCGAHIFDDDCGCEIVTVDGYDRETGPYEDTGCAKHNCRI